MNDGTSSLIGSLKGLNLNKILNTASRTLNFVNKAIPMYKEIKPTLGNLKNIITPSKNKEEDKIKKDEIKESRPIKIKKSISNNDRNTNNDTLTFFQ